MNCNHKIQANTRYAFACIGMMMLAFIVTVIAAIGLHGMNQIMVLRLSMYAILLFAVLGGIFSIRVAYLRKQVDKWVSNG